MQLIAQHRLEMAIDARMLVPASVCANRYIWQIDAWNVEKRLNLVPSMSGRLKHVLATND